MRTNGHSIVALALVLGACTTTAPEDPWAGKLYVGDKGRAGAVREQTGDVVACSSDRFDGMICMSADDFERFAERYHYFSERCLELKPETAAALPPAPTPEPAPPTVDDVTTPVEEAPEP